MSLITCDTNGQSNGGCQLIVIALSHVGRSGSRPFPGLPWHERDPACQSESRAPEQALPPARLVQILQISNHMKAQPPLDEAQLSPVPPNPRYQRLVGHRQCNRRWQPARHQRVSYRSRGTTAGSRQLLLQQQVELASGNSGQNRPPTVHFNPQSHRRRHTTHGPGRKRLRSKFAHQMGDPVRRHSERQRQARIGLGEGSQSSPEPRVVTTSHHVTAKFQHVRRS